MKTQITIEFDNLEQLASFAEWAKELDTPVGYTTVPAAAPQAAYEAAAKVAPPAAYEAAAKAAPPAAPTPTKKKGRPKKTEEAAEKEWTDEAIVEAISSHILKNPDKKQEILQDLREVRGLKTVRDIPKNEREAFLAQHGVI